jgi:hypothetical protein
MACYRNSVSFFSTIQLRLINEYYVDFQSYFISVTNFRLVCLLPVLAYVWTFVFDPRVGRYEISKMPFSSFSSFFNQYYMWNIQYNGDTI